MYRILRKEILGDNIFTMDIEAGLVANKIKPGQFIILIVDEKGERIPLTVCDTNKEDGSINIVVQIMGYSTYKLSKLNEGDYIKDLLGPLGLYSKYVDEDVKGKNYLLVAGGIGTAPIYPQVKWLKENGANCDVIVGARSKDLVILEDKFRSIADNVYVTTDDGSYGMKGMVTDKIIDLYENKEKTYDECISIGPVVMMKFVSLTTKKYDLSTTVSMNPIMIDGTGMCGACRLTVDGEIKFACVDGPEFDGHKVDYDEVMLRINQYKEEEKDILNHRNCDITRGLK